MNKQIPERPFDIEKIHVSVKNPMSTPLEEREAFNDVIKYGDIIQGSPAPRNIEDIPKWYRKPLRIFIIIALITFAATFLYETFQIIAAMLTK